LSATAIRHSTPGLEPGLESERGWESLRAPELFNFDQPGKTLVGKLIGIASVELSGKPVTQYLIRVKDQTFKVLATFDLAQKITRAHLGYLLRIKYRGEDSTIKKKGNSMKIFDVQVKPDPDKNFADGSPIADEDIPF